MMDLPVPANSITFVGLKLAVVTRGASARLTIGTSIVISRAGMTGHGHHQAMVITRYHLDGVKDREGEEPQTVNLRTDTNGCDELLEKDAISALHSFREA